MPADLLASPLGTVPADSRFCSRNAGYTVLYASPDFATAFLETVVRDKFTRSRLREVAVKEITERGWGHISARRGAVLTLLDLRGDGCTRIGAPTDVIHARNHAAGRAFATAIHGSYADVDGLLHVSRLTGRMSTRYSTAVSESWFAPRRECWWITRICRMFWPGTKSVY